MAEFAVALPVLVVVAFGVVDFGRALYLYNALSSVARDGARYGAALTAPTYAGIQDRVTNVIAPGYLAAGDRPASAAVVVDTTTVKGSVNVKIRGYTYRPWTPLVFRLTLGDSTLTINTGATFRREWP